MVFDEQHQHPPLLDADSFINISSSSSEDTAAHDPQASGSSSGPAHQVQPEISQQSSALPFLPLGDGLFNILQAYSAQDDSLTDESDNGYVGTSLTNPSSQAIQDDLFLPENVNMVPPNEAHLQLTLGRVQTHFTPIPVEHDLSRRISAEGMALWEKYFAPKMHGHTDSHNSSMVDIPVSWFNFITLMLLTPEKFDWAKGFLSSQLWDILKEPLLKEDSVRFAIPDKCVTTDAPSCVSLTEMIGLPVPSSPSEDSLITPKRKRREGKVPMVESEVRRSPRLVLLNDGYKNHANCSDRHCLTCNAAPPIINTKVVKNLAMSFCKVPEETVEKRILKKSKLPVEENKNAEPKGVIGSRKNKNASSSSQSKTSGQQKAVGFVQQTKK
jgi:hypothetical protein